MIRPLGDDLVELWEVEWPRLGGAERERLLSRLTEDERTRFQFFRLHDDRLRFGLARGLLREISAVHLSAEPEALVHRQIGGGKPSWEGRDLSFNVSHSGDWIYLAFARGLELGVDVQSRSRDLDVLGIAKLAMHPDEEALLAATAGAERRDLFGRLWTLREAALKAVGEGALVAREALRVAPPPGPSGWITRSFADGRRVILREIDTGGGPAASLAALSPGAPALRRRATGELPLVLSEARRRRG